jgi:PncC family amidohydrolase
MIWGKLDENEYNVVMEEGLEIVVGKLLRAKGLRLAIAESCTGGLIGDWITDVPGSSTYYMGSITAYAYEAKVRLLDVRWSTLESHGAVSAETVAEMALGVRRALAADVGLSVSGIAGPTGGTSEKPVGTVWFGISSPTDIKTRKKLFDGERRAIKKQAGVEALSFLIEYLDGGMIKAVEVVAKVDSKGRMIPKRFKWNKHDFYVDSIGRRWVDKAGEHILVMVQPHDRVYELLFTPEGGWLMAKTPQNRLAI